MNINKIAQVNVSLQTAALSRAGFGTIMVFGDSTVLTGTRQVQTLTFSDVLVTANTFNMDINGTGIAAQTFDTDNDTTLDNIATAIQASADIFRAERTSNRVITITTSAYKEASLTNAVVANGASQATTAIAETVEQRDEVRTYTSIEGVAEDFATTAIEYKKALAAFSQSPRISELKIARRRPAVAQVITVNVPTVSDDTDYVVTLNGNPYTYSSGAGATAANIVDGLITAINAGSEPVTLVDNGDTFTITADIPGESISISVTTNLSYVNTNPGQGMADDILRAKQVDNNFYFIVINTELSLDIREAAKTTQALEKLFFCQTSDADVKNNVANNLAAVLKGKNYTRTILSFTDDTTENRDATYAAAGATSDPGSITWVYKKETGVTAPVLTATQEDNLTNLNVNYQVVVKGQTFSFTGKVIGGDFIDTIRGIDFFTIRLQEDFLETQLNVKKIPYTDKGIQVVASVVQNRAQQCADQGIFDETSLLVTAPKLSETQQADRLARKLTVKFSARLQGAIHTMVLNANVTV